MMAIRTLIGTGLTVGILGCAQINTAGNFLLNSVGLTPAKNVFDGASGLVNGLKTPNREEEYYLGRAVSARILSQYSAINNEELQLYVNTVGRIVANTSGEPNTFGGYHFLVIDSSEVNALSAPGGFVFVTRGMLGRLPDEDALAAVLAHEVSHVSNRHGIKAISQADLTKALTSFGEVASSLECSGVLLQATGLFDVAVKDVVDTLLTRGYSRDQEFEADKDAATILGRAGYDPKALIVMLQQLEVGAEGKHGGWYDTHPASSERIQSVQSLVASFTEPSISGHAKRTARFSEIMKKSGVQ